MLTQFFTSLKLLETNKTNKTVFSLFMLTLTARGGRTYNFGRKRVPFSIVDVGRLDVAPGGR